MTNNLELIKAARRTHVRLDGTTNVCALDDDDWPCGVMKLVAALEATGAERDAAHAVIAEAVRMTRRGNMATPPWVIAVLEAGGSE